MLRERLIDTATRLHIDEPLIRLRARLSPRYNGQTAEGSGVYGPRERQQVRDLLAANLTATSNCIDIGAYRGRVLGEIVRIAPQGRHIAYEPQPHLHELLVKRFPSVEVRQAALSDRPGQATFTIVRDAPGLSGFRNRWQSDEHRTEEITVPVETLDGDLPPGYAPDFIKVDVEGAEGMVFEGAIKMIAEHKPTILFEHGKGGADHYATPPSRIFELLCTEGGLRIFDLDGGGPYSLAQFEDAFQQNNRWDFLARR
jgi:FkbM family methyltransferase